jgi:cell division protein FtsW
VDPAGAGWQAAQSKITLGSGGLIGAGPGAGWAKLEFLPDVHTDFIFASLGEELGFVGASIVLLLFLLLILRGLRIAHRAPDPLGTALAGGISTMFFVYTALHVAVVTGLFPVTGLPLPFVSYGGSALVVNLVATGILLNVSCAAARSRAGRPGRKGGA